MCGMASATMVWSSAWSSKVSISAVMMTIKTRRLSWWRSRPQAAAFSCVSAMRLF